MELESTDKRRRILSFDAEPEAGIVAHIGVGLMLFKADQTNGDVLGAGHNERLCIAESARASSWEQLIREA
jgi:hypothetical protein